MFTRVLGGFKARYSTLSLACGVRGRHLDLSRFVAASLRDVDDSQDNDNYGGSNKANETLCGV